MALIINPQDLQTDTLDAVIEDHITSGADQYQGDLRRDTEKLRQLLMQGKLLLQYSEEFETLRIVAPESLPPEAHTP